MSFLSFIGWVLGGFLAGFVWFFVGAVAGAVVIGWFYRLVIVSNGQFSFAGKTYSVKPLVPEGATASVVDDPIVAKVRAAMKEGSFDAEIARALQRNHIRKQA